MTDNGSRWPPKPRGESDRLSPTPSRGPSGSAPGIGTGDQLPASLGTPPGGGANRVYPIRYAYCWTDTSTGAQRIVEAISRDDAYESAAGIRRIQHRRRRDPDATVLSGFGAGLWVDGDITPLQPTGVHTVEDVDIAAQICREVLESIAEGIVPADVSRFGELHEYVDANMYADEWISRRERLSGQCFSDFIGQVQDVVTGWLQSGRPPTFAVTPPVGPVIVQLHPPTSYADTRNVSDVQDSPLPQPAPRSPLTVGSPYTTAEVLQQATTTEITVNGVTTITYHLVPDETRWHRATPADTSLGVWVYRGPEGYRGVLTKDRHGLHWGTILRPGGERGSLDEGQLSTNLEESKLAVEGMVAIEAGIHHGRRLEWINSGPDPHCEAVEIHEYEGPFDSFAVVRVGEDGVVRLSVYGRCEPICQDEPVESVDDGKSDAIATIQTLIGSATQLDTYTATTRPYTEPQPPARLHHSAPHEPPTDRSAQTIEQSHE
ncbi:hypothetical protein [Nocardia sp. NPDC047038]|uniref:hypothetical protein n=1 Tax=Nocardia sp. NPDC047038 TaxID=3154338 RepID=UPI0033F04F76